MRVPLSNLCNSKNPQDFPSFITCKCYLDQGAATRITQTSWWSHHPWSNGINLNCEM